MKPVLWNLIAVAATAAGCSTPVPALHLSLSDKDSQACPSTQCENVPLLCPAVMSVKIMDPARPDHPFLTQCTLVSRNGNQNMCSLASVDLIDKPIPVRSLEVQVALYPESSIPRDPGDQSLLCPDDVAFAAGTGFPVEQTQASTPSPALGGVGYYTPGDSVVTVDLGCTDLSAINESCIPSNLMTINAQVESFATGVLVGVDDAARLDVSVGEPVGVNDHYELKPMDTQLLKRQGGDVGDGGVSWGDELSIQFTKYACLSVLEVVAQSTATVICKQNPLSPIDLRGVWIDKKRLDEILTALGPQALLDNGITIGMVVDQNERPVAGATVLAKGGTVTYLSKARTSLVAGATSDSGIFVSTDAPFGTEFATSQGPAAPMAIGIGGKIQDRVTVVILRPNGG